MSVSSGRSKGPLHAGVFQGRAAEGPGRHPEHAGAEFAFVPTVDFTDTARIAELAPVPPISTRRSRRKGRAARPFRQGRPGLSRGTGRAAGGRPRTALGLRGADPGRRRGWLLFSSAKLPLTRATRIDRAVPQILAGKDARPLTLPSIAAMKNARDLRHGRCQFDLWPVLAAQVLSGAGPACRSGRYMAASSLRFR